MAAAFNQSASDIHLEPEENTVVIRYRIDGVLQKVLEIPHKSRWQLSRWKTPMGTRNFSQLN